MGYTVSARCGGGHEQEVEIDDLLGIEWALEYAALLDGSSSLFLKPPAESGDMIGHCGICGQRIECKVVAPERQKEA